MLSFRSDWKLSKAKKKTVNKRIGVAKGKLHVPDNFSEWDKEVRKTLFEDGDKI